MSLTFLYQKGGDQDQHVMSFEFCQLRDHPNRLKSESLSLKMIRKGLGMKWGVKRILARSV